MALRSSYWVKLTGCRWTSL